MGSVTGAIAARETGLQAARLRMKTGSGGRGTTRHVIRGIAGTLISLTLAGCTASPNRDPDRHVIVGEGIRITLTSEWVGAPRIEEIPPPDSEFAQEYLALFEGDDRAVLLAYRGDQLLVIAAIDAGRELSLAEASTMWLDTFEENGFTLVSRDQSYVDGHRALRVVSTSAGSNRAFQSTTLEYVFPLGSKIWVIQWMTPPNDFAQAEQGFTAATETIALT